MKIITLLKGKSLYAIVKGNSFGDQLITYCYRDKRGIFKVLKYETNGEGSHSDVKHMKNMCKYHFENAIVDHLSDYQYGE